MVKHLFVALLRVFRLVNTYNLNLRELVQTVQTSYILTIRSGFTTEALGISTVLDGEVFLIKNDIAIDVGYRHLCCWDKVEIIHLAVVHLTFFVRQLTCAITRGCVNHRWRHDFSITGLVGFSKEEVDEGTLELCALADINRKACASDLHTKVKVNEVVFLGKFPVGKLGVAIVWNSIPIADSIIRLAFTQRGLHHYIIFSTGTFWYFVIRNIGNRAEVSGQLLLCICFHAFEFSS